jgi:hypothetical protein
MMPKDPQLPDRFARLVLEELAEIHGLLMCVIDQTAADVASDPHRPVDEGANNKALKNLQAKSRKYGGAIYKDLMQRLYLKKL